MYINDKRRNPTCAFSLLNQGELFAYEEGEDVYYLMVIDEEDSNVGKAVVLGTKDGDNHLTGAIWDFQESEEVQPLKGDLSVWAK